MAKASVKVKRVTDGAGFEGLLKQSEPGGIKVGWLKGLGKHPNSNANISEIAAYNEFGTDTIPERPFLRTTIAEQINTYKTITKELLGKILTREMKVNQAVGLLGLKAVADVKNKITAISEPANAPATIDRKGSSNPLIDTGLMRQSVNYEMVK